MSLLHWRPIRIHARLCHRPLKNVLRSNEKLSNEVEPFCGYDSLGESVEHWPPHYTLITIHLWFVWLTLPPLHLHSTFLPVIHLKNETKQHMETRNECSLLKLFSSLKITTDCVNMCHLWMTMRRLATGASTDSLMGRHAGSRSQPSFQRTRGIQLVAREHSLNERESLDATLSSSVSRLFIFFIANEKNEFRNHAAQRSNKRTILPLSDVHHASFYPSQNSLLTSGAGMSLPPPTATAGGVSACHSLR